MNIFAWNFLFFLVQNNAGVALEMLEVNPNLATAGNKDGKTVLQLLARNPSAFVGETQSCELFWLKFLNLVWWYIP